MTMTTRSRAIQLWFVAFSFALMLWLVLGSAVTLSTAALLIGLGFVPPAIVAMLWPKAQGVTAGEIMRGNGRS
jgi:L-lactate permease